MLPIASIFIRTTHSQLLALFAILLFSSQSLVTAIDMRDLVLFSPITSKRFPVVAVPPFQGQGESLADMGADDDGCRHSSGASEYDYFLAIDPDTYFTALVAEWDDRTGQFRGKLTGEFKVWLEKEFNSQWQIDINKGYQMAVAVAKASGTPPPDRRAFALSQGDIPIERRYDYAYKCYAKRGARPAVLAKVSLMGAWALRCRMNLPIAHTSLMGGYKEVNDKLARLITQGEKFSLSKWLPIYRDVFENSRLTDEAYLIAGLTTFGMEIRDGNLKNAQNILDKLTERLKSNENGEIMRGIVRSRITLLREYLMFTGRAATHFMEAISGEEFPRSKLPETLLVVAECLRRQAGGGGQSDAAAVRAMDWYLALSKMAETQPKLRDEMRAQGRVPGPDSPYEVQLGWIADSHYKKLTDAGVVHAGAIAGVDKALLTAIVFDRMGYADFVNSGWRPITGATQADSAVILDLIGKAILDFAFRNDTWPATVGELWERGFIKDRNFLNRFYCPVTGKPYLYKQLTGNVSTTSPATIIATMSEPVPTNQGPRYGVFLGNATVIWSATPVQPGELYKK